MSNVLLFESDVKRVPHLVFVLKLAGISCTVAGTVDEVINWLSAACMGVAQFDLLVLSTHELHSNESTLLRQSAHSSRVPVIVVNRSDNSYSGLLAVDSVICSPDNLLNCLKKQLKSHRSLGLGEKVS